jgi:RimJ/RimL family protein N-acetyltransferase
MTGHTGIRLEPWADGDLPLLRRLMGDPAMTEHLGGPETEEKLRHRQGRYERLTDDGSGRMYKVVLEGTSEAAGSVGYWEKDWRDETVYETGWSVLPEFQGRGIAVEATRQVIELARAVRRHRALHAFPSVENAPSNAICRKLGFELLGEHDFEYPKGHWMRCADWRLQLFDDPSR